MSHCGLGLSCEPIAQIAIQVCHHGYTAGCYICSLEHRVNLLESILTERIEKLEQAYKADAETCKDIIFAGAETHASILRCEAKIKELEKSILETRIQFIGQIDKNRPYKCPICDGKGKIILGSAQILLSDPPQYPTKKCESCDGKGIVWG